jgi:DNA polymerase elongation subunit (family B)
VHRGNDITKWGERTFYKVQFKKISNFYYVRKRLRNKGVNIYDDQVSLASQWFIERDLRPCSCFEVEVNPYESKRTTCDSEFYIKSIRPDKSYIEPFVLSYDIECLSTTGGFPDPNIDPIITIGCYSKKERKCFCLHETPGYESFETERDMIQAFLAYVSALSPDILTGYNINRFDNTYLETRCGILNLHFKWSRQKKYMSSIKHITTRSNQKGTQEQYRLDLPGIIVMDGYEVMRGQHNLSRYSLEAVAQQFLGTGKNDMPYDQIPFHFQSPEGRKKLADYCVMDCKLVVDLFDKLKKVVNLIQMAQVTGCFASDVLNRGQGIRTITLMQYYCKGKIHIPRTDKTSDGFQGAVVLPPKKGMYRDAVICVDFASLYPSIMRALNMCYSTLVTNEEIEKNGWVEGEDVLTVPDYDWVDGRLKVTHNPNNCSFVTPKVRQGVLPLILATVYNERKKVKKYMKTLYGTDQYAVQDGKQLALKVVMNSIYGFTGAKKGFLPEPRIASSVTKYGRGLTLRTMDSVNNNPQWKGSEVIYGDSVSGDTPLLVLIKGAFEIVQIKDLASDFVEYGDKQSCELSDVQVWSDTGWTNVERVIRHKVTKKMYRVLTEDSFVDVTEDHSLLKSDGTPVKPTKCTRDLMEVKYPDVPTSDMNMTYWEAFYWGLSLVSKKCTHGVEYEEWKVPTWVLLAPLHVAFGFFEGVCSHGSGKEKSRKFTANKEHALRFQYLAHRVGYNTAINFHARCIRVVFKLRDNKTRFKVTQLPRTEQWVYDLTTKSSHFHVGPGKLVVHNTDSCFVKLSREFCDGKDNKELVANAHVKGEIMASDITKMFRDPVLMEYEMAFEPPFVLMKRKKYFGKKCEPGKEPKTYIKGIECIRRDYCPMVIKTQRHMIDLILDDKIDEAVRFVQGVMAQVYAGEIPIDDLALTKKLSQKPEEYKSTAPHVDLALRLKGKYQAGERVEYFIKAGRMDLNKRAITREEIAQYPLDYAYYAERQLWEPIQRIMDLVVERNVFCRRRVTAPITSGAMAKFVKVTKRKRTQRVIKDLPAKKKVTDADIRSFFG